MDSVRNFSAYTKILREEIMPATGCTDPISIAYCAAKAHSVLGMQPTAVNVSVSQNILKNTKGVVIPNTNGLKGIRAAVAAGIVCGDADREMQVIGSVTEEQRAAVANFMDAVHIDVSGAETDCPLYISVTLYARTSYSRVVIANGHSNIVEIMKNGEALLKRPIIAQSEDNPTDRSCLNLHDIVTFADRTDLSSLQDLLDMQIRYNTAICEEGLKNNYGAGIGKMLLAESADDIKAIAKAYAAAGSDAHNSGCDLPTAILCRSGNQGITATVPIVCYAKRHAVEPERMYRALILSDLFTIYLKAGITRNSSLCSAAAAGCAAGAGIAYLLGGDESVVSQTLYHAIFAMPGMICSGANMFCSVKIAAFVEAGILSYQLCEQERKDPSFEWVSAEKVDAAIRSFASSDSDILSE